MIRAVSLILLKEKIVQQVQRTALAFGLFVASWILGLVGIIGGLASIFFSVAKLPLFTQAAAITGGISILLAIIVAIEGMRMLRSYHH